MFAADADAEQRFEQQYARATADVFDRDREALELLEGGRPGLDPAAQPAPHTTPGPRGDAGGDGGAATDGSPGSPSIGGGGGGRSSQPQPSTPASPQRSTLQRQASHGTSTQDALSEGTSALTEDAVQLSQVAGAPRRSAAAGR